MPAVSIGLGLAERVVRRHIAKLEAVGWLRRTAALRGKGSLVWLTAAGHEGLGLELALVKAPTVFSVITLRSVEIAWAAANAERHGLRWLSARELSIDREPWQITVANERGGHSHRLPDLVLWPPNSPLPVAIVLERDYQHPRRRRAALQGWQAAITAGRYAQIRYQTSPLLAHELHRLAAQIGLGPPAFIVGENMTARELEPPATTTTDDTAPAVAVETQPAPTAPQLAPDVDQNPREPPQTKETPEPADQRQRLVNELLAISEPQPAGDGADAPAADARS